MWINLYATSGTALICIIYEKALNLNTSIEKFIFLLFNYDTSSIKLNRTLDIKIQDQEDKKSVLDARQHQSSSKKKFIFVCEYFSWHFSFVSLTEKFYVTLSNNLRNNNDVTTFIRKKFDFFKNSDRALNNKVLIKNQLISMS